MLYEFDYTPKILLLENRSGLLSTNGEDNYRAFHMTLVERNYNCGAIVQNVSNFVSQFRSSVLTVVPFCQN